MSNDHFGSQCNKFLCEGCNPLGVTGINVPGKRVDVPNVTMDTPAGPFRVYRVPPGYAAPSPREEPSPPQQQPFGESKRLEDLRQQIAGSDPDTRTCVDRQVTDQSTADEIASALRECHVESTKKN